MKKFATLCICIVLLVGVLLLLPTYADAAIYASCTHCSKNVNWKVWDGTATASGHYYLTGDVQLSKMLTIASGGDMVIDLKGFTITAAPDVQAFRVNGTLSIVDTSEAKTGKITGGRAFGTTTYTSRGGNICVGGGTFNLYSGSITDGAADSRGGNIYVTNKGVCNIYGGIVSGGTVSKTGGSNIYINYSTLSVEGGEIIANSNAKFANITAFGYNEQNSYVHISGGMISGSALSLEVPNELSEVRLAGGTIAGNTKIDKVGKLKISGKPVIESLTLGDGVVIHAIDLMELGASIKINATSGKFTTNLGNAAVFAGYFETVDPGYYVAPDAEKQYLEIYAGTKPENPAGSVEIVASGLCGGNTVWSIDDTGTLTLSGKGDVTVIGFWHHMNLVNSLVIEEGITSVGSSMFGGYSNIKSVTIPGSMTEIGEYAFMNCSGLETVYIGDGVEVIGDSAFFGCTSLQTIVLGNSVTVIGASAFSQCSALTSVVIPDSVTTIGAYAFNQCDNLQSITLGYNVTTMTGFYPDTESLTHIYITNPANWCKANVGYIPDAPHFYGDRVHFLDENGNEVTDLVLGDGITEIGDYAFRYFVNLTSVTIGGSVNKIGLVAFAECPNLKTVTLNTGVTTVGRSAFSECENLEILSIAEGVTTIEDGAFYGCGKLQSVTIPASATDVGDSAFRACTSLTGIWVSANNPNYSNDDRGVLFNKAKTVLKTAPGALAGSYTIPQSVSSISDSAFGKCLQLTDITIPEGVTVIKHSTFSNCAALTSIAIPKSVTTIDEWAFSECTALESIELSDSVTSIGYAAFSGCSNLKSVNIPKSLEIIPEAMFWQCSSLTEMVIPDSVTIIYNSAFADTGLVSVSMSDNVTMIGSGAFYNTNLTAISLPDTLTIIGNSVFTEIPNLKDVYFAGTQEQWEKITVGHSNDALTNAAVHFNHSHDYTGLPPITVEATCKQEGYAEYICVCGDKYTEILPKLPHNYVEGVCADCGTLEPERAPGDLDDIEGVTTDDVVALLLYLSMPDIFKLPEGVSADFTGDGVVTTDDAVVLLLHISMPDLFPLT